MSNSIALVNTIWTNILHEGKRLHPRLNRDTIKTQLTEAVEASVSSGDKNVDVKA